MKKHVYLFFIIVLIMSQVAYTFEFEQMFPEITGSVRQIKQGSVSGITNYGYVFSVAGVLSYYNTSGDLVSFPTALVLADFDFKDTVSDEIFCAYGFFASESDAIYKFSTDSESFEWLDWAFEPKFLKKLPFAFFSGDRDGLNISFNGHEWGGVHGFNRKFVLDAEETADGKLFVSVYDGQLFMRNGNDILDSLDTGFSVINDIYVRKTPNNNDVLVTLGDGSYSDGLYKVLYNDSTITGLECIDWIMEPNLITEYNDYYIVTCQNDADIYVVPFDTQQATRIEHGLDITKIYCISDQYPIYTENFLIGTDKGIFMATGSVGIEESILPNSTQLFQNYPNPFNPVTQIKFDLAKSSNIKLSVYNISGQLVSELASGIKNAGHHKVDFDCSKLNSGVYYYSLEVDGLAITKKMILLK